MKQKHHYLLFISSLMILLTGISCHKDSPVEPLPSSSIQLSLVDVGTIEVWLSLKFQNTVIPNNYIIQRNGLTILAGKLFAKETLIVDSYALPRQKFSYKAFRKENSIIIDSSVSIECTTMDTTSHAFTWYIDTLTTGITSSSILYDATIINENSIWLVGEIYTKDSYTYDSLGHWIDPYNAAYWNGQKWELRRIYYYFNGKNEWAPIISLHAFDENDIWFAVGNLIHWDGHSYTAVQIPLHAHAYKMLGISSTNIYVCGDSGSIVHYDGSTWTKEQSGTALALVDIYNKNEIVVSAGVNPVTEKGVVLKKSGSSWEILANSEIITPDKLFKPNLYGWMTSVWIDEKNTIYAGGNLLFRYQFNKWDYVKSLPENYIGGNPNVYYRGFLHRIRGNKSNDMWIVGDRNTVRHFNGSSWTQIGLPYDPGSDIIWRSIVTKNNVCIVVGDGGNKPICLRIYR